MLRKINSTALKISLLLAIILGIAGPVIEVVRRWHQLTDLHYFFAWFDDFLACGFLLFAALRTYKSQQSGQRFLTAAWGFATGMMYSSFFIQWMNQNLPDPSGVPVKTVLVIKFTALLLCAAGLLLSLKNITGTNKSL